MTRRVDILEAYSRLLLCQLEHHTLQLRISSSSRPNQGHVCQVLTHYDRPDGISTKTV